MKKKVFDTFFLRRMKMQFLVREVQMEDKEGLLELAQHFPLCSLPKAEDKLIKKIQISRKSFEKSLSKTKRNYLFVLEDKKSGKIIGSSQILSYFGEDLSLCYALEKKGEKSYLSLNTVQIGRHQIGGLIMHPDYRKSQDFLGLQIGLVRFLYIKTFPEDFSSTIEVSLTAPVDGQNNTFWEETGYKYLNFNYSSALKIFQKNRLYFFSLFPKNLQIDLDTLSSKAKQYLTEVHPQTLPAYKGLLKIGFSKTKYHHVLDGGIYLKAQWDQLPFLKKGKRLLIKQGQVNHPSRFILSQQTKQGFFCWQTEGEIKDQNLLIKPFPPYFEEEKPTLVLTFPF